MRNQDNLGIEPKLFRLSNDADREDFDELVKNDTSIRISDTIEDQLRELIRIMNPGEALRPEQYPTLIENHLKGIPLSDYGVWVYYPWNGYVVHILDEDEFIAVRTNRNVYKIDFEEIRTLRKKKVGVIGLSVGQSIALTMAMERICGELRLADFDDVELSNMNRIQAGVQDLGVNKVVLAARQIAELDPFIKIVGFTEGLHGNNIDDFFLDGGALDILVEECDGIDMKILSRRKARSLGIPVVMDTNDNGMLDVERFDIEPDRLLLHGAVHDLEPLSHDDLEQRLKHLTLPQKVSYLSRIIGMENVSSAMKKSLSNMNKTIVGWPQLASAVMLGGAMVTDTCRKILLGNPVPSGRYFVDFDELIRYPSATNDSN